MESSNKITSVLLAIYLVGLIWILLFKMGVQFSYMADRELNLIPFREYVLYNSKIDRSEIILNILIFIPLGIYVTILKSNWNLIKIVFVCFFVSLTIESLQFILAIGAFDITDVITNTSGGIIGTTIYYLLKKILKSSHKTHKFLNIIAAAGTIVMIVLLFLLKINMLPFRYQ